MQGTHAGVNACLRLQRAWSDSSAEGDPKCLSQSPVMIQAPASLGILLLSQLKKMGWDRVPKLTAGVYKDSLPSSC